MRYARTRGGLYVVRLSRSCLMSPVCITVCNKSKLTVTETYTISLQSVRFHNSCKKLNHNVLLISRLTFSIDFPPNTI